MAETTSPLSRDKGGGGVIAAAKGMG